MMGKDLTGYRSKEPTTYQLARIEIALCSEHNFGMLRRGHCLADFEL